MAYCEDLTYYKLAEIVQPAHCARTAFFPEAVAGIAAIVIQCEFLDVSQTGRR